MKIAQKLILGFVGVSAIAALIGGAAIYGLTAMDESYTEAYLTQTRPIPTIAAAIDDFQRVRVATRDLLIYANDSALLESTIKDLETHDAATIAGMDQYAKETVDPLVQDLISKARSNYVDAYKPIWQSCVANVRSGDFVQAQVNLNNASPIADVSLNALTQCMDQNIKMSDQNSEDNTIFSHTIMTIMICIIVVGVAIAVSLGVYLARSLSNPIKKMATAADAIALGNTEVDISHDSKDELGHLSKSFATMLDGINKQIVAVTSLSKGDLTIDIHPRCPQDSMGHALEKLVANLNNMFGEINTATQQVSTGAKQIANGSQALAQGTTEQAASVQQLSSSINEVSNKTKENAEMADKAATLANTIKDSAEKGNTQMTNMMNAVKEISDASQSISKVIKVIDDIAFQTNILALNAAVEAARAGQHGKGFAVVAEEVRNLAAKSAEAAKDTSGLIANSMDKATLGAQIASETADSLVEIVEGINQSSKIVTEIAQSSNEQSAAISQINKGVDQVAQVVQQNSATAEQSAAASQEMSGQSSLLQDLVSNFKLKNDGFNHFSASNNASSGAKKSSQLSLPPKSTGGDFVDNNDKY